MGKKALKSCPRSLFATSCFFSEHPISSLVKQTHASRLFLIFVFLIATAFRAYALTEGERDHLRMLPEWLPYMACQETKMLKQCFVWTTEECELSTGNSAQSCLNQHRSEWMRPGILTLDDWKQKISDCVVRDIKAKLKTRTVASMLCQNKGVK